MMHKTAALTHVLTRTWGIKARSRYLAGHRPNSHCAI